ncbi:MAG TPA: MoaD/ThiS family protein [Candidatus Thiothrix moscowensis]|uniref:MoaD/ThiS family protein n=1 Tax=unclassified Thiothrix TaxID=2636184 RepID=UPI0025DE545E|nr:MULTISPECIES: MoaD/ThiS family protein [unclassified Thiothrix]HRJ52699.1 MoaD/ThiS family protein [Candidatus Thiothrix moscowensis]HRJ92817.1 MoaD/ThiS family protein [Candidatus Thiothrix moscowensis]
MNITLKLYANLSPLLPVNAQRNAVAVEVPEDATLNTVIDLFRVPREQAHLVLLNGVFVCHADRDQAGRLKAGDTLAIWPPVAGG